MKDLTLAHVRQWGWRFVDEFCWRNTRNGVPGGWPNRFKNAWEPVFHFARSTSIRFNPDAVSAPSDDVFEYSPDNPKSESGSGLLGSGKRSNQHKGLARPSNVIEVAAESGQGIAFGAVSARPRGVLRESVFRSGRYHIRSLPR